ncbi:MAG: hypothetical protein JJU20_10175 [Opitutales bacterium]|nr:hypothetical protein [Opitutales bacterium]
MTPDKDIIETIEKMALDGGWKTDIDEGYFEDFLKLSLDDLERLTVTLMFSKEKSIRRRYAEHPNTSQVPATVKEIETMLFLMSRGHLQINVFSRPQIAAIGNAHPTPEMEERLNAFLRKMHPFIHNTVQSALPWFLSRDKPQQELPL